MARILNRGGTMTTRVYSCEPPGRGAGFPPAQRRCSLDTGCAVCNNWRGLAEVPVPSALSMSVRPCSGHCWVSDTVRAACWQRSKIGSTNGQRIVPVGEIAVDLRREHERCDPATALVHALTTTLSCRGYQGGNWRVAL